MKRLSKRNLAQNQRRRVREHQADEPLAIQPLATSCGSGSLQSFVEQSSDPSMSNVLHQIEDGFLVDILGDGMLLEHLDMNYGPPSWMSFVPLTDDQMANQHQVEHSQGLAWNRRQALQSALSVASQLLGGMEECTEMARETAISEEQRNIPSFEFLYWMLNGIVDPYWSSSLCPEKYSFIPSNRYLQ